MEGKDTNVWCRAMECKHIETSDHAIDSKGRFGWCTLSQLNVDRDHRCADIKEPNLDSGCDIQHERKEAWAGAR